ncbi:MAG: helix-turn-helix transcriptional regulator [bacterium]|nr:helix-turn-helix transcriptional regulator [bacterium]
MPSATIGGLIKDYRIKKRLSQLEVSLKMGWKETSRLSRIEQGRVGKPTRKTVERLFAALGLNGEEKAEFLDVGNYLPTEEEVKKAIQENKLRIENWPHPAYLIDFSWRLLYSNDKTIEIFKLPPQLKKSLLDQKPNLLEFAFAPKEMVPVDIFKGDDKNHLKPFSFAQTAQFKVEQKGRENESWYDRLIRGLMQNPEFLRLWKEVKVEDYHKKLLDYEYKVVKWLGKEKKEFHYHIFTSRHISDPRFQVVLYLPADGMNVVGGSSWVKEFYDVFAPVRKEVKNAGYDEKKINTAIKKAVKAVRAQHAKSRL